MTILIIGSFICLSAQSIEAVIVGRIIQPAGGAAGVIVARIIVMDIYQSEKAANVMSKLVASMMISPLLGVPLGGLLTDTFGWRSTFILIGAIATIVFLSSLSASLSPAKRKLVQTKVKAICSMTMGNWLKIRPFSATLFNLASLSRPSWPL
jgi:DHA1 family bicyclomycin/chloramphenicol resistance-like MFS transporter